MGKSLLKTAKSWFTEQVTNQISAATDENEMGVKQVITKAMPLVINALITRSERSDGPQMLRQLAQEAYSANVLHHLSDLNAVSWQRRGLDLMQGLLGEEYVPALNRLATTANVELTTARTLLGTTAAAVLAELGRHANEHNLDADPLADYLHSQKGEAMLTMMTAPGTWPPSGGGGGTVDKSERRAAPRVAAAPTGLATAGANSWKPERNAYADVEPAPTSRFSVPVRWQLGLLVLLAVSLGYYFGRGQLSALPGTTTYAAAPAPAAEYAALPTTNKGAAAGHYDSESDNFIYDTGQPIILKLADGTTQKIGAYSTENRLYTFLSEPAIQVDSVNRTKGWINFDRIYFEPSKAVLTPESHQQLQNVASILKTFPNAVVKIGGYTDTTGTALQNLHLSEERARTAMIALADMGISVSRLQSKGYGGKYFITSNATPEGRALNRRISVRVVQK